MMMKSLLAVGVGVLTLVLSPGWSGAQSGDNDRIRQLEQDLMRMRQDLESLRHDQKEQGETLKKASKFPVDFSAAITVRYDLTEVEDQPDLRTDESRDGFRLRTRFGADFRPDGPVNAGLRISTGESPNPTSPFVRFGDVLRSKSFSLDQAWVAVHPLRFFDERHSSVQPVDVTFITGRMPQPFWRGDRGTFRSEIIWDDDISPEGIATKVLLKPASNLSIEGTGGYFILEELDDFSFSGFTGNAYVLAGQIKVEYKPFTIAVAYYDFEKLNAGARAPSFRPGTGVFVQPGQSAFLLRDPGLQRTNSQVNLGAGSLGFVKPTMQILSVTGQAYYQLPFLHQIVPEIFFIGEYANNVNLGKNKLGYGLTLGVRGGKEGSGVNPFNFWATYRDVDADATLATYADSDLGGGTDYRGIELGINYKLHKNLLIQISGFHYAGFPSKDNYWRRIFADVTVNF